MTFKKLPKTSHLWQYHLVSLQSHQQKIWTKNNQKTSKRPCWALSKNPFDLGWNSTLLHSIQSHLLGWMERWSSPSNCGIQFCWAEACHGFNTHSDPHISGGDWWHWRENVYIYVAVPVIRVVSECCWRRRWTREVSNYGTSVIFFGEVLLQIAFNERWHIQHHPAQIYWSNFTLGTRDGRKFWINQWAPRRAVVQQYIVDPVLYQFLAQQQRRKVTSNKLPQISKNPGATFFCLKNGCNVVAVESEKDWQRFGGMISHPILSSLLFSLILKLRCLKNFFVSLHPL